MDLKVHPPGKAPQVATGNAGMDLVTRIKELEKQLFLSKQENEDLRINIKINKESL